MPELTTKAREKLRSSQFAYVDSDGGEHLPIHDESELGAWMVSGQAMLLPPAALGVPEGFEYASDFVSEDEEHALLDWIESEVEFKTFEMRGQEARRRVAHFGWEYGYYGARVSP